MNGKLKSHLKAFKRDKQINGWMDGLTDRWTK